MLLELTLNGGGQVVFLIIHLKCVVAWHYISEIRWRFTRGAKKSPRNIEYFTYRSQLIYQSWNKKHVGAT
jgi:hypothetical protein